MELSLFQFLLLLIIIWGIIHIDKTKNNELTKKNNELTKKINDLTLSPTR
jgi:hypothetical protein